MSGVNKAIIVGRLGADPELKQVGSTQVCKLSVATSESWKDKDSGEKKERTEWHRISVWGNQADACSKYLSKGREVYVEGQIRYSDYEKDGVKMYSTDINASNVQFLGGKNDKVADGPPMVADSLAADPDAFFDF